MNSLDSSNTPLEGGVGVPTHSLRGGVGTVQHPPQGGCWTVGTPPHRWGVPKKIRSTCLPVLTYTPNILLHPPIFEILENTLLVGL